MPQRSFGSDNHSGIHPTILQALLKANEGHAIAYGGDEYTQKAVSVFKEQFGPKVEVLYAFNGTGSNIFALSTMTGRSDAIFCADIAHVYLNESTAAEALTGCRLIPVPTVQGKITVEQLEASVLHMTRANHGSRPRVVTITQPTEYGTIYSLEECRQISAVCHQYDLLLHVDGARFFNAAAGLSVSLHTLTEAMQPDILSLGGTKNGLIFGEAILFFHPDTSGERGRLLKRSTQQISKQRFVSCQFGALLTNELWREIAENANKMAGELVAVLSSFEQIVITQPTETNAVFCRLPEKWIAPLQQVIPFHVWDPATLEVRMVCSFNTTTEDIRQMKAAIENLV